MKISDVIKEIEKFAPLELAAEWDNSGWQLKLADENIKKVMLALSPTQDVIDQAIQNGCNLLITHHPLIFSKINRINSKNPVHNTLIRAIQNKIQIYCAHTNLDVAPNGIATRLANIIGLTNIETQYDFVKIGELEKCTDLNSFIKTLKTRLNINKVKVINPSGLTSVKKVALCPGSGGEFANKIDADIYITGDIKYHTAIEAENIVLVDAGHFETERIILSVIKDYLADPELEVIIAEEKYPWEFI